MQSLTAVKNDHFILVEADIISRGGPRIVDAIEMVAELIHPECFSLPVSNFSTDVTSGDTPLTVQFTDLSQNATGWDWDFGDGDTSTDESPEHTYSTAGTYTANLTVSNENGTSFQTAVIDVEESSSSGGSSGGNSHKSSGSSTGSLSVSSTSSSSESVDNVSTSSENQSDVTSDVTETVTETPSEPDVQDSEQNSETNVEQTPEQTSEQTPGQNSSGDENTNTPGFEIASGIICLICVFLYKRR